MAVSSRFASASSLNVGQSPTATVSFTAATAGNRMLAICTYLSVSATPSTPTGWTVEQAAVNHANFGEVIWSKTAVGGETSISSTLTNATLTAGTRWALGVVILSGANAASPAFTTAQRIGGGDEATAVVYPQITPTYADAYLVELSALRYVPSAVPGQIDPPTSWTEGVDTCTTNTTGGGALVGAAIAIRQRVGGASTATAADTATATPATLSSNYLYAFPATTVAVPAAVPAGWSEYRAFKRV